MPSRAALHVVLSVCSTSICRFMAATALTARSRAAAIDERRQLIEQLLPSSILPSTTLP